MEKSTKSQLPSLEEYMNYIQNGTEETQHVGWYHSVYEK